MRVVSILYTSVVRASYLATVFEQVDGVLGGRVDEARVDSQTGDVVGERVADAHEAHVRALVDVEGLADRRDRVGLAMLRVVADGARHAVAVDAERSKRAEYSRRTRHLVVAASGGNK